MLYLKNTPKLTVREQKNILMNILAKSTQDIGHMIRSTRKQLGVTQSDLALAAGTGLRFIIELEKGKATCQIGKILDILQVLNIQCDLSHPEVNSLGT